MNFSAKLQELKNRYFPKTGTAIIENVIMYDRSGIDITDQYKIAIDHENGHVTSTPLDLNPDHQDDVISITAKMTPNPWWKSLLLQHKRA